MKTGLGLGEIFAWFGKFAIKNGWNHDRTCRLRAKPIKDGVKIVHLRRRAGIMLDILKRQEVDLLFCFVYSHNTIKTPIL